MHMPDALSIICIFAKTGISSTKNHLGTHSILAVTVGINIEKRVSQCNKMHRQSQGSKSSEIEIKA